MVAKPESRLRSRIIKRLREHGGRWIVTHGSQYQEAGVSDILGCLDGKFWALELKTPEKFKRPGHGLTPLQVEFIKNVRDAGGVAFCVCSVEQVEFLLNDQLIYGPVQKTEARLEAIYGRTKSR